MGFDAKNVIAQIKFIDSRILKLKLDNNLPLSQKIVDFECRIDYSLGEILHAGKELQGTVTLTLSVSSKEKRKNIFSLQIDIEGAFSCDDEMAHDMFVRFLSINGVSMLYSIARTNIITITGLSYPGATIRIPMINIAALNEAKAKNPERNVNV